MNNFVCAYDNCSVRIPVRSTKNSAGYDFIAPKDFMIPANSTSDVIDTGISVCLDDDKVLMCYVRSSWGFKYDIVLCNGTGIIDADFYPNTVKVKFRNNSDTDFKVKAGDKMMQGVIMQYFRTDNDKVTEERTGGIGSTGA